ncbi:TPA: hypothetical protein NJV08_002201 [Corynebacterium striatum]|nr:hypothetical protein [Corynebacterium striatum]HCG2979453.1 hypothetical protein [Corynebacterium striatum]HCG2992835.1 hypothetical protein [Corynebacterium striatum]HCG2995489.1 hypothetical protein [Corynebacterium striatum]HCH2243554.1 hypothetical protein [Corynebacterium striatum]
MTTLDDLTPLQRQELIGTWVDLNGSTQPHIYLGDFTSNTGIRHGARLFNPTYTDTYTNFEGCTPRPDLPRAWAPNGKPAAGEWEYAVQYLTPDGWKYSRESWDNRWQESEAVQEVRAHRDHPGQETRLVRRLASQPEVMEE